MEDLTEKIREIINKGKIIVDNFNIRFDLWKITYELNGEKVTVNGYIELLFYEDKNGRIYKK